MSKTKTYTIGGTVYELLGPVFAVLRHVAFFCRDAGDAVKTTEELQEFLRDKTGLFVAGLITPQGVHPADRDLDAIALTLDWVADPDIPEEVLHDFFTQPGMETPEKLLKVGTATNMLAGMILPTKIARTMAEAGAKHSTPSSATFPNSPEATPSSESKSSGGSDTKTSAGA